MVIADFGGYRLFTVSVSKIKGNMLYTQFNNLLQRLVITSDSDNTESKRLQPHIFY